jgi:hypothetical protein
MKRQLKDATIIFAISMIIAFVGPNFIRGNKMLKWPGISDFAYWTFSSFIVIIVFYLVRKPKEEVLKIPDGYHELHNANDQVTRKGMFSNGRQVSGTRHIYKKDGTFSCIENCTNGVYNKMDSTLNI